MITRNPTAALSAFLYSIPTSHFINSWNHLPRRRLDICRHWKLLLIQLSSVKCCSKINALRFCSAIFFLMRQLLSFPPRMPYVFNADCNVSSTNKYTHVLMFRFLDYRTLYAVGYRAVLSAYSFFAPVLLSIHPFAISSLAPIPFCALSLSVWFLPS